LRDINFFKSFWKLTSDPGENGIVLLTERIDLAY